MLLSTDSFDHLIAETEIARAAAGQALLDELSSQARKLGEGASAHFGIDHKDELLNPDRAAIRPAPSWPGTVWIPVDHRHSLHPHRFSLGYPSPLPAARELLWTARGSGAKQAMAERGHHGVSVKETLLMAFCVAGIWASYLTQGVLSENLSTKKFGPDGKRFEQLTFLNLMQNVVCLVWAACMLLFWRDQSTGKPPLVAYWSPSVSNSIGPACGIVALKYISYPAQVLAKSSKMIPVMLMGALVYGVSYSVNEYVCTLLVAGGVSVFALFKGSSKAASKLAHPNAPLGYFLCFANLALDGFTNATQDSITKKYRNSSVYHIMMGMNLWGAIYTGLYMFAWPAGGGLEAVRFCAEHREAALDILLFCLCGAVGQYFIFLTINSFGSLVNTTITTTRKFVSILISALWTGSPLSAEQWAGVCMVFAGLSLQILLKWRKSSSRPRPAAAQSLNGSSALDGTGLPTGNGTKRD